MITGITEEEVIINRMLKSKPETARSALSLLYTKHAQDLFEFLFLMLGRDKESASDLVHDSFLRAFEKRHLFDASRPFRPWLFRIASNLGKNEFRRRHSDKEGMEELVKEENDLSEISADFTVQDIIWNLVDQLKPDHREVVILRFRTGLQVNEIAEITGIPEGTVKSRLFYGLRSLSQIIYKFKNEDTKVLQP